MKREKRLPRTAVRQPVLGKPLTVRTVAIIVLSALFLTGCATHRKSETASKQEQILETALTASATRLDSASEVVEIRTEAVKVPMSAVTLTIATDSLRSLPAGASYSERSGQASVKVSRKAATATEPEYIYVYASCDSLELQCERYERTIRNLHKDYGEQLNGLKIRLAESKQELRELEEKPPNPIGTSFKWFVYGLLGGILIARIKNIISIIKKVTRQ